MNCKSPIGTSNSYTSHYEEGFDLRYAEKLWSTTALSECRLDLLMSLERLGIGVNKVGSYMNGLVSEFRSKKFKEKG